MAKFYGLIGYEAQFEEPEGSGIWKPEIIEREYCGDILQNTRKLEEGEKVNDDLNINNRFSIIADPYAYDNAYAMKYIIWRGTKWKIRGLDLQHPRIILSIGGIYNGNEDGFTY